MIKLTAPNGDPIDVRPDAIDEMYVNHGGYDGQAKAVLIIGGQHLAVRETIQEIDSLLSKAG